MFCVRKNSVQYYIYIPTNFLLQTCKFTNINLISILKMFVEWKGNRINCWCSFFSSFFSFPFTPCSMYACTLAFILNVLLSFGWYMRVSVRSVRMYDVYSSTHFNTDMWMYLEKAFAWDRFVCASFEPFTKRKFHVVYCFETLILDEQ